MSPKGLGERPPVIPKSTEMAECKYESGIHTSGNQLSTVVQDLSLLFSTLLENYNLSES